MPRRCELVSCVYYHSFIPIVPEMDRQGVLIVQVAVQQLCATAGAAMHGGPTMGCRIVCVWGGGSDDEERRAANHAVKHNHVVTGDGAPEHSRECQPVYTSCN